MHGEEFRRGNTVAGFGSPLPLFPVAPKDEDGRQDCGECKGEPGPIRHFCEGRGEIEPIEGAEHKEPEQDEVPGGSPDDEGYHGNHARCDECYENHTNAISLSKLSGLKDDQVRNPVYRKEGLDGSILTLL